MKIHTYFKLDTKTKSSQSYWHAWNEHLLTVTHRMSSRRQFRSIWHLDVRSFRLKNVKSILWFIKICTTNSIRCRSLIVLVCYSAENIMSLEKCRYIYGDCIKMNFDSRRSRKVDTGGGNASSHKNCPLNVLIHIIAHFTAITCIIELVSIEPHCQ